MSDNVREALGTIAPIAKQLPSIAYYSMAVGSVLSGGPFAAPAAVTLIYNVAWYNSVRLPVGAILVEGEITS